MITALLDNAATDGAVMSLSGHIDNSRNEVIPKYASGTPQQALAAMQELQHSWIARLPTL